MALVVMVVMAATGFVVIQRQSQAMLDQVTGYGASLARFIAAQNAVAALAEDWSVVDVSVQEMMKTGDFQSITVIDRENIVRSAGDPAHAGLSYARPAGEALGTPDARVAVSRYQVRDQPILGFETPITFQGKPVGHVALGLAEARLVHVAQLSRGLMAVLVLVTVLAVAVAMYFVADWFARPVKLVIEAMDEIGRGHVEHRIAEPRNDEFGLLFAAFDRMAQALQAARGTPPGILRVPAAPPSAAVAETQARAALPRATP
jgi:serine/threonine-protein kinase